MKRLTGEDRERMRTAIAQFQTRYKEEAGGVCILQAPDLNCFEELVRKFTDTEITRLIDGYFDYRRKIFPYDKESVFYRPAHLWQHVEEVKGVLKGAGEWEEE